jgi:hypothetical protein
MVAMETSCLNSHVTAATGKRGVKTGNGNRPLKNNTVQVPPICRMCEKKFMQRSNTDSTVWAKDVSYSEENIKGFRFQRCMRLTELRRRDPSVHTTDGKMEEEPPSWLNY